MDSSLPGSSVHGISQARILEWVVIYSSRGSSILRDRTRISYVSCIGRQFLYHSTTWEAPKPPPESRFHKGERPVTSLCYITALARGGGREYLYHMQVPEPNTSSQSSSPVFSRLEFEELWAERTGNWVVVSVVDWGLGMWWVFSLKEGRNEWTEVLSLAPLSASLPLPWGWTFPTGTNFPFHRWRPSTNHPDFLTHGQIWVSMVRFKWGPIYLINYTKNAIRCSVR